MALELELEDFDDVAVWPAAIESHFITLLHKESKKNSHPSKLDKKTWKAINDDMFSKFGKRYTVPKLKAKYNRLRRMHRAFSDLLAQAGVRWDPATNVVHATNGVWEAYLKKYPTAKRFRKKGCNHYDLLGEIFNNLTSTNQVRYASTHSQSGSEDEDKLQEPHTGAQTEAIVDIADTNESGTSEAAARRRTVSPPENARPTKQRRRSENSKLDNGQGAWTKDWNSRIETSLLRTDQFHKNNEMLPSGFDPYSVAECMDKLESIPDVENVSYFRAMERFLIPEWRQMFIKMSEPRRRKWLESLKN